MTNKKIGILTLIFIIFFSGLSLDIYGKEKIYILPIKGEINRATRNLVRDNIIRAEKDPNVKTIIFEIDTYGGLIDEAIQIKDYILRTDLNTISYVNNKAESAGVLIAIASEKLAMNDNSTIGSAETIPSDEKVLSMWKSILRDTAQFRGRNEMVVEGMADKLIEINGVKKEGQLVNLTAKEAVELDVADCIKGSCTDIIDIADTKNYEMFRVDETFQMLLAKNISSPYVSSILLFLGFIGLIIELITPGFGIGAAMSILGFGLYFAGNVLAGHSKLGGLAFFLTGLLLMIVEFFIPGFGISGISGLTLMLLGLVFTMESLGMAFLSIGLSLIATMVFTIALIKLGFKSETLNSIILKHSIGDGNKTLKMKKESIENRYINKEGVTISNLRPSGFINIDGEKLDAISLDGYIGIYTLIKVVKVEGNKIYVKRCD